MSAGIFFTIIVSYFSVLILISWITGRKADSQSFFLGNRKSPWYVVAFGMIGTSLSGVTFISVPGWVGSSEFSYMQMVFGFLAGYFIIANVLMPLYYRMELTSIYKYFDTRFGKSSYKTGASFFLISRIIGASFRLFLVANVLQIVVFDKWGIPFFATVLVTIALIWVYTYKGGIKTIVWTDTLQTLCMIAAIIITIFIIGKQMNLDLGGIVETVKNSGYARIWIFDDWSSDYHFVKQFLGGVFIAIVMTGMDQDMMQKNLSCKNIKEAKKNMYWMSFSLIPVNFLFLVTGALLYIYASSIGLILPENSDDLYPLIATGGYLGNIVPILFMLGLIAAAYSSADSALTALTTSFTVDILDAGNRKEADLKKVRMKVHLGISLVLIAVILLFRLINNENVISAVYTVAGYTYGPLLGLFAFGLLTRRSVIDKWVPVIAVLSPVITYFINRHSEYLFWDYTFGFELLIVNGFITFTGLLLLSILRKSQS